MKRKMSAAAMIVALAALLSACRTDTGNLQTDNAGKMPEVSQTEETEKGEYREGFSIQEISDDLFYRMKGGNTYKTDCIVPREDLRYLLVLHKDIDGNVHQGEIIEPATGKDYLDRTKDFDYKIEKSDLCYTLFIEKGFEWGGDWTDRKDFQHFELPADVTEKYSEIYSGT